MPTTVQRRRTEPARLALLRQGLVAYWRLDEADGAARVDRIGDISLANTNTVQRMSGKLHYASHFTKADSERLSVASSAALQVGGVSFTWAFWYLLDSAASQGVFLGKHGISSSGEYMISHGTNRDLLFDLYNGAAASNLNNAHRATLGTWNLAVCWYNAATGIQAVQVDGGIPVFKTSTVTPVNSAEGFAIGARNNASLFLDGGLGPVMFWKRVLNDTQRAWLWNAGHGLALY